MTPRVDYKAASLGSSWPLESKSMKNLLNEAKSESKEGMSFGNTTRAVSRKRQGTAALQDAWRFMTASEGRASVLECGSPLPLSLLGAGRIYRALHLFS